MLSQGKLKLGKEFIISYGKIDGISGMDRNCFFDENNKGLEIKEV
ncbi:MAG: hypothetical protein NY202_05500 [Mollicutes bacterium UO1]